MRLDYLLFTAGGAAAQIFATMALIYMFKLRNFAIGTMLTKVDILMTAIIGTALFSESLSIKGVIALMVVVSGVLLMTVGRMGIGALNEGQVGSCEIAVWKIDAGRVSVRAAVHVLLSVVARGAV